jgi:hypothetical protein
LPVSRRRIHVIIIPSESCWCEARHAVQHPALRCPRRSRMWQPEQGRLVLERKGCLAVSMSFHICKSKMAVQKNRCLPGLSMTRLAGPKLNRER